MNFEPLLHAPLAIQIHVATVVPAAIIGLVIFMRRKGTRLHKALGRLWVTLMAATAISSFFIHQINLIGGFSPIHLLSILVLSGRTDRGTSQDHEKRLSRRNSRSRVLCVHARTHHERGCVSLWMEVAISFGLPSAGSPCGGFRLSKPNGFSCEQTIAKESSFVIDAAIYFLCCRANSLCDNYRYSLVPLR